MKRAAGGSTSLLLNSCCSSRCVAESAGEHKLDNGPPVAASFQLPWQRGADELGWRETDSPGLTGVWLVKKCGGTLSWKAGFECLHSFDQ